MAEKIDWKVKEIIKEILLWWEKHKHEYFLNETPKFVTLAQLYEKRMHNG